MKYEQITINNHTIEYGAKEPDMNHDIYRVESFIVRNDKKKTIVLPGEYVEFESEALKGYDGEVTIEPFEQKERNPWPPHAMSRVIQGRIRIANSTDEPVQLVKSAHVAKIRRVLLPLDTHHPPLIEYEKINTPVSSLGEHNINLIRIYPDSLIIN